MPISEFWVGTAIGTVLGFGAGLIIFLPIVWRLTDVEDTLDQKRGELNVLIKKVEQLRAKLDALANRRIESVFDDLKRDALTDLNDLAKGKPPRKMENYGRR